ncbi:PAS domain S-box protein [Heliorestis acidaminivorans]|uniref:histidine kinase n=1 Tax=Heliorestis acidaminivorans TaxID=553427 RepID=A0A6I0ENC7_9FIRM|nr:ATP-binding protein [Heliorestis acidaminivorans]KAB2951206.1 PAS domain S-box protein [Heliorestis acidaminivorans]
MLKLKNLKLSTLPLTKKIHLWIIFLILLPTVLLALLIPFTSIQQQKKLLNEQLLDESILLATVVSNEKFMDISWEIDQKLDKEEQIHLLNQKLQGILEMFPNDKIGRGYYSIALDSIVAISPNFSKDLLVSISHDHLPYFEVYDSGEVAVGTFETSLGWDGKSITYAVAPIILDGQIVGHSWATTTLEHIYLTALKNGSFILLVGLLLYALLFLSSVHFIKKIKNEMTDFAETVINKGKINSEVNVMPELNLVLNRIQKHDACLKALLHIHTNDEQDVITSTNYIIKEIMKITKSPLCTIGYLEESEGKIINYIWPEEVAIQCKLKGTHGRRSLRNGGIWTKVINEKKPLLINDFEQSNSNKSSYPQGHVAINRLMAFPVMEQGKVVMVSMVANKKEEYTETDFKITEAILIGLWKAIKRKETEEKYKKIFNNSSAIMSLRRLSDGKIIEVNDQYLKTLSYSRDELIGKSYSEIEGEDGSEEVFKILKHKQQIGEPIKEQGNNIEVILKNKAGESLQGIASFDVIKIAEQEYLLTIVKDITLLKQYEEELKRLDRLNIIGQMAAGIGHEIRNPMATVRGFLQLLQRKEKYADEKAYFDLMVTELDRANEIITEFLSLSKKEPDSLELKSLNEILTTMYPLIEAYAFQQDKQIRLIAGNIPPIYVNEKEIHQLLLNLVRNALEASPLRGIVTLKTEVLHDEVILTVKDRGKGIDPTILKKIGTPFFTTKEKGTGLGLAVSYSIVERHKGKVFVESSEKGSVFKIHFPLPAKVDKLENSA